jgi:hypothetical protein
VVAFFGRTDAYRAAPVLARLLVATGAAFDATVVAADAGLRTDLLATEPADSQRFEIIDPTEGCPSCSRTPTWWSAPAARRPGSCSASVCRPHWSGWWTTLAARGWAAVDGRGVARVADALLAGVRAQTGQ